MVSQWVKHLQRTPCESLSVSSSAAHTRTADWILSNLSVAWLCPVPSEDSALPVTFRQGLAGLAALDVDLVEASPVPVEAADLCWVACSREHICCFTGSFQGACSAFAWDDVLCMRSWHTGVWQFVKDSPESLVILSLAGSCCVDFCPSKPIKAKAFRKAHAFASVIQDVLLLFTEPWLQEVRTAVLLPCIDEAALATLKRLPGVSWVQGSGLVLVYCGVEAQLPECLFHFL